MLGLVQTWPDLPICDANHKPVHRTARQLRPAEIDELVAAYQAGDRVRELATRFGVSRDTVGKHLRSRGIDTKPPGLHPDDVPEAARLYRSGWPLARVAEKFNTTASTVQRRLLELEVRMRDTNGRERQECP
ncbi:helix-turn-helix domain containing protein [Amycolatopsis sp. RTGN1]|uniref:helix-turn-helix domain containing protein n=1 Tax=Amycolatopsis ponsaeliensis TaxID=2992142 RepID=UPI00255076D4|nr:helix-turn-helix domain containing protein [Amycolatopsis sp. RTGN1]